MSERIQWIQHGGEEILYSDFSELDEAQYMTTVDEMEAEILTKPRGSHILILINIADSNMTPTTRDRGKQTADVVQEAGITSHTAAVGISGVQRIIVQAISNETHFAKNIDSAKDWLVSQ
jgi:phosphohistidine swiveling domain-containing protein